MGVLPSRRTISQFRGHLQNSLSLQSTTINTSRCCQFLASHLHGHHPSLRQPLLWAPSSVEGGPSSLGCQASSPDTLYSQITSSASHPEELRSLPLWQGSGTRRMFQRQVEGEETQSGEPVTFLRVANSCSEAGWEQVVGSESVWGHAGLTPVLNLGAGESPWSPGWATCCYLGSPPANPGRRGGGGGGTGWVGGCLSPLCSRSIRRRDGCRMHREQRSAAVLDQSPRRLSPWQRQHQAP